MKSLAILLKSSTIVAITVMIAGLFGKWHFLLDICSHFRVQAALTLVVAGLLLYWLKRRRWGVASLVAGLGLTATLWPYYLPGSTEGANKYRLLTLNVMASSPRHDRAIEYILESDPDFIVLQEVNSSWIKSLDEKLASTWPHREAILRFDDFGVALYSKFPWKSCGLKNYSNFYSNPALAASFKLADDVELRLVTIHPASPMNHAKWESRNVLFDELAKDVQANGTRRTIVAGDFNCTPWSYWYRRFVQESGLRNAAEGQGFHVTWMPIPIGVFGLPIDHVLVGSEIGVSELTVGPYVASDHRGVVLDFE